MRKRFDFLSVDTDSYDFFMVEAILMVGVTLATSTQGGFRPRVIMVEYNANFELDEAKSILPPGEGRSPSLNFYSPDSCPSLT